MAKVIKRYIEGGRARVSKLPKGPNGRCLCRWCGAEVPPGRRTFCQDACVHEWRLRSDGRYLREQLFKRDRGRCCGCGLDCHNLEREMKYLYREGGRPLMEKRMRELDCLEYRRGVSYWIGDHIVPVWQGGGQCDLSNMQTLCIKCSNFKTTLEARQRARIKRQARIDSAKAKRGPFFAKRRAP